MAVSLLQAITDAGLTAGLKLCLDAGDSSSYNGGQSWLDRSGGGYDFYLGATSGSSSDDPTFNGSAGGLSSAEYFSVDGGDFFQYDATMPSWMQALHQDGAVFSIMAAFYRGASSSNICLMGDGGASFATGFQFICYSALEFRVRNASVDVLNVSTTPTGLGTNSWAICGLSLNEPAGPGGGFFYFNGNYKQVSGSNTFDPTYSSPAAGNATETLRILDRGGGGLIAPAGTRIAWKAVWQGTVLSKANMDSIYARMAGRHFPAAFPYTVQPFLTHALIR